MEKKTATDWNLHPLNVPSYAVFSPQVYYWRDSSQLRWLSVSRAMKSKGFPAVDTEYTGVLDELLPYSNYKMHIVVANNRYDGPPSHTIQFSTPEGGKKLQSGTTNQLITKHSTISRTKNLIHTNYVCFQHAVCCMFSSPCLCVCLQSHLFPSPSGSNRDIWTPFMWTGPCRLSPTASSPATRSSTRQASGFVSQTVFVQRTEDRASLLYTRLLSSLNRGKCVVICRRHPS